MRSKGKANGNYRLDSGRKWTAKEKIDQPTADKAREKMIARENKDSLTDDVVNDYMGGKNAAQHQANAYEKLLKSIKSGRGSREPEGSLADAARERMKERNRSKNREVGENNNGGHPDIGRDKANRRAYQKE